MAHDMGHHFSDTETATATLHAGKPVTDITYAATTEWPLDGLQP